MDKEKLVKVYNMLNSSDKDNMYMGFKILESYDVNNITEEIFYLYMYASPALGEWQESFKASSELLCGKMKVGVSLKNSLIATHNWHLCIHKDKPYMKELLIEEHMKDLKRIFKTLDQEVKFKIVYE
jgi:hypothetical protein